MIKHCICEWICRTCIDAWFNSRLNVIRADRPHVLISQLRSCSLHVLVQFSNAVPRLHYEQTHSNYTTIVGISVQFMFSAFLSPPSIMSSFRWSVIQQLSFVFAVNLTGGVVYGGRQGPPYLALLCSKLPSVAEYLLCLSVSVNFKDMQ